MPGHRIVVLAGVHVGCYELFAKPDIRRITELRGKSVAADSPLLLRLMAAQVGLDPANDIHWVTSTGPSFNPLELFTEGKIDAFLGFPPNPQELLSRPALGAFLQEVWNEFDVILFDTPPAKFYADALNVAFRARSVMLLARKDHTRVADTTSVIRELGDTGVRIIGTVFNAF